MKRLLFSLTLSMTLVACQSGQLQNVPQLSQVTQLSSKGQQQASIQKIILPVARDIYKPEPQAQIKRQGNLVQINMPLPALPGFKTQALDFGSATKITVTLTDSNGNVYQPVGADGNGQVAYPPGGNLNLDFNNVYPDRLIVAELKVHDSTAVIPQTDLALAFSHLSTSNANVVMNFSTTPAGKALKTLLGSNATRARAINLADLQTLVNAITGRAGTAPNFTYTTHPGLVNTAQLATDLATQDPTALTAANYRFSGATVNATVSGLVASDALELQVTDAASAIKTNAGNGLQAILKAAAGTGLKILARNSGTPGTSYTYNLSPANLTLTEGGTQAVTVTATPATPTITGLSVSSGSIGSSLTITGTNFHTATAGNVVKFGTTTATVTAATATSLTVTVPAGISGTQNVTVSVGTQTNIGTNNYAVVPAITSLSPTAAAQGASIVITGTGFDSTAANNTVKFGTTSATVTAATATSLTVTVPAGISVAQDVSVQVGTQTSANTAADNFTVTPGITSLSASAGVIGSSITITGTGYDPTPANNTVKFGTTTATVTAATATTLTVTVPAGISGTQDVSVQVGAQTSANTAADNFSVTPGITSLSTASGVIGSSITITGTGFDTTPANNTVKFGTTTATVTAATATSLTVTVPAGISGTQNVTVQVGTQTNSGTNNYAVVPAITSLSPTAAAQGASITINGTGFDTTSANNTVKFGTTTATVTAATATSLTVTVPAGIAGAQDVSVQVGAQTSANTAADNFTVTPGITSLSASAGVIGSSITITGTGYDPTPANNTVQFGTTTATVTAATATTLTVTVPAGISGAQNVTVTVSGQTNSGTNNYNVTPSITSLSVGNGVLNDSITLTGTGFSTTLANNTVKFGTTSATVTAATATSLTVTVPNAPSGAQNITVQVGTQTSTASAFTVNPKITGLSTAFGTVVGKAVLIRDEILTISGGGFDLVTAANNQVSFGGTNVAASAINGSNLEVRVPTTLSTGDVNITVTVNTLTTNAVTANMPVTSVNISGGLH